MKDKLNWREVWEAMRKQRMRPLKITFDPEFRAKFAEDSSAVAKYNNYEYGMEAIKVLSEILDDNLEVLEIGPGPGTLTIPLAKRVRKIVAVESSETAVKYLRRNMKESRTENVEIMNEIWLEFDEREIKGRFDLAVCSHFLWQMKDLEKQNILKTRFS